MNRGLFISFEGVDGCGKSTQVAAVHRWCLDRKLAVLLTREPGGTAISEKIRELVMDARNGEMTDRCEVLLYLASRAQHVAQCIRPALARGELVLCDRFAEATMAYQGFGRNLDIGTLRAVNAFAADGLAPDLVVLFDLPVETAWQRMRAANKAPDRLESNARDFHQRVRDGYRAMAEEQPQRFAVIDARRGVAEVTADTVAAIGRTIADWERGTAR